MSMDPKVIDPPDYDLKNAAEKHGIDAGVLACPVCQEYYNDYGGMRVVQCRKCDFQFPVDWWSVYSAGVSHGRRIKASGAELSGGMKIRMDNPYYRTGFNTLHGDAWRTRHQHSWRALTVGWKPELCKSIGICSEICERCGQIKDESRRNRSGECVKCESETECRHRGSMLEECCRAGVNFKELGEIVIGRSMPCYYSAGTIPIHCDKYERRTVEEIQAEDAEMELHLARHRSVWPLVSRIKKEHKGENWQGLEECPVCKGQLYVSHAAYNGHVHGQCVTTKDCLSWME